MDPVLKNLLRYYFFGLFVAAITFAISPPKHPWVTVTVYAVMWGLFELVWLIGRLHRKRRQERIHDNITAYIKAWSADHKNESIFAHIEGLTDQQAKDIGLGKVRYEDTVAPKP